MRFYTYNVGAQLVRELDIAGAVKQILHDGGDIIHLELLTGERLMVHLIESAIPLYEIRNILKANHERADHTLFILWGTMLLPGDGRVVPIEPWHEALLQIYRDQIYAYDIHQQQLYVYPVYFERLGYSGQARIRYGTRIDVGTISPHLIDVNMAGLDGQWRVAAFDGDPDYYHRQQAENMSAPARAEMQTYYALLEVASDAPMAEVKTAYRGLARRYHPDVNGHDPDATRRMQNLNQAYNAILKDREREDSHDS